MSGTTGLFPGPDIALRAPVLIADDFLPAELAGAMRSDIDAHFGEPAGHGTGTHQVWNYWFVPELHTCLRTSPERVIRRDRVDSFVGGLRAWAIAGLGMGNVSWPVLSLYVGGCRQALHTDATNGRFAFVYSLTRDQRRTSGGEIVVFREGDPFRGQLIGAAAGRSFYDAIEPKFNRLAVFDERLPHAVERVEGTMDPLEGRFLLHGHLSETGMIVAGVLHAAAIEEQMRRVLHDFGARYPARLALYQGPLALRLVIGKDGAVETCAILFDRVAHPDPGHTEWEPLLAELMTGFKRLRFPSAAGETTVTQPLMFGARPPGAA
jgi:hypothetical protein